MFDKYLSVNKNFKASVNLQYDLFNEDKLNFTCESFNINESGYKFENITINNFILKNLEVSNEYIALIKIK